jgi:hypothetical protein
MRTYLAPLLVVLLLATCAAACSGQEITPAIRSAGLYLDPEGTQPTDKYAAEDIFYCIVELEDPVPEMVLQISWVAADTDRAIPDYLIKIEEVVPTSSRVVFQLINEGNFWPTGLYKVYLYQDEYEIMILEFDVYWELGP